MLKILIYDDEQVVDDILRPLMTNELETNNIDSYEIVFVTNQADAEKELEKGIDILFQDIELPENENGIRFACMAKKRNPEIRVIFITAYIKYCEEIFVASPSGFLVKPFTKEKVHRAFELVANINTQVQYLNITDTKNKIYRIGFDDISYIEGKGRKLFVYDSSGEELHCFAGIKVASLEHQLPKHFIRCHHSFCINLKTVTSIERYHFTLNNGAEIPISQRKFSFSRDSFINFMGDMI